jgi:hypothetical protein
MSIISMSGHYKHDVLINTFEIAWPFLRQHTMIRKSIHKFTNTLALYSCILVPRALLTRGATRGSGQIHIRTGI